ncbi:carbamoyltransferase C-terminal domain-containing protein [Cryptosporangium sp. NPDC048952]|uniref:carbamoyltransferase C-terminal domain-containing protein n=1 Tax=Cryptosporangium sp. NPDC048952 TaxID=3363961 RepID=UPI0037224DED
MTVILGVNAGHATFHDPSACLTDEHGTVLAFVEEERLTRVRHAPGVKSPALAVAQCLDIAGLDAAEVDVVAVGWDEPRMSARAGQHWGFDSARDFTANLGLTARRTPDVHFVPHHRAHAASAFHASGYDRAAVLVVDGNGEDESISIWRAGHGQPLVRVAAWPRIHSLGHLYEAASTWLGLGKRAAGKTMGLAAYGNVEDAPDPGWLTVGPHGLISVLGSDPGEDYESTRGRWLSRIAAFAGADRPAQPPATLSADPLAVRVAAAAQATAQTVVGWLADQARKATGIQELCLAGGVGLNCAANGRLPGPVYVPPIPHDAGVALGAAWSLAAPRRPTVFSAYTGAHPRPLPADLPDATLADLDVDQVVDLLVAGQIIGVCRGRSEVGPRALCHRSFLALPVAKQMRERMNGLKRREQWRPFGPVTHTDPAAWWSPIGDLDRYMLGAATLTEYGAALLPAVQHADGTTRPQLLRAGDEEFVHALLDGLADQGYPPVLLNTSFNGPGEPLVDTATQAVACARRLGAPTVIIDDVLVQLGPPSKLRSDTGS